MGEACDTAAVRVDRAETLAGPVARVVRGPAVVGGATAVVIGLLAVIVVSRSTPSHVFVRQLGAGRPSPTTSSVAPGGAVIRAAARPSTGHLPPAGNLPTAVLIVAIAVFLLAAIGRLLWAFLMVPRRGWWLWAGRRAAGRGGKGRLVDAVPWEEARAAVVDAVTSSLDDVIGRGDVATAIIRSWLAVEAALHDAGLAARRSDTSTDLVERALGSLGVREKALRSLASLYREARFSTHVLGERHRESARRDLAMIASDLVGSIHAV